MRVAFTKVAPVPLALCAALVLCCCGGGRGEDGGTRFLGTGTSSPTPLPDAAEPPSQYPSTVLVSGMSGTLSQITVSLNITHTFPDDIDAMLVGPQGQTVFLMSDCGGSTDVSNLILTFTSAGGSPLPDNGPLTTGTYAPSDYPPSNDDTFYAGPAPVAPPGPYPTSFAAFLGTDPNGAWRLYVKDDSLGDSGVLNGWTLVLNTQ